MRNIFDNELLYYEDHIPGKEDFEKGYCPDNMLLKEIPKSLLPCSLMLQTCKSENERHFPNEAYIAQQCMMKAH